MYFFPFLFAIICMGLIVVFPFVAKKLFKIEGCVGLSTGICCNVLCLVCGGAALGLALYLAAKKYEDDFGGGSLPFSYTFSEFWREPYSFIEKENIQYYYYFSYLLLDVCIFILLIFSIKRLINRMTSNSQIFNFISGFSFTFTIPFFIGLLCSLDSIGSDGQKDLIKYTYKISYAGLIFSYELFVFSFLLQLAGTILLLFLWLKNKVTLMLFISLGVFFVPFIILIIGIAATSTFVADILTPILYWPALGAGIFFYWKSGNDGGNEGGYSPQPM